MAQLRCGLTDLRRPLERAACSVDAPDFLNYRLFLLPLCLEEHVGVSFGTERVSCSRLLCAHVSLFYKNSTKRHIYSPHAQVANASLHDVPPVLTCSYDL